METTHVENRKVPAWIGSILFHSVLLLFVLFWFSFPTDSNMGVPGVRNAVGTISLQPSGGGGRQQADSLQNDQQAANPESATNDLQQFSTVNLSDPLTVSALSPGPNQTVSSSGGASASDLMESLRGGAGIGDRVGAGVGMGEATVSVFGTEGKGTKFVYVFDRSASMEGTPIRAAKRELIQSLDSLGDHHQFNIIFYSSQGNLRTWKPGRQLLFASESNKQDAARFVLGIMPEGGTRHFEPLLAAIAHRPDVIFFLTDGEPQDDLTSVQLNEIDRQNNRLRQGTQINVIQFSSGGFTDSESRALRQLADQNQGAYRYVNVLGLQ